MIGRHSKKFARQKERAERKLDRQASRQAWKNYSKSEEFKRSQLSGKELFGAVKSFFYRRQH